MTAMTIEIVRCPNGCSVTFLSPFTTCPRCQPRERYEEEERMRACAIEARAMCMDRYNMSMLAVSSEGVIILVRDAFHITREGSYSKIDDLIRDLEKLRAENTEVLAENARLRRARERKP